MFRQGLNLDPNNPDALNVLGILCQQEGQTKEAVQYLRRAVELRPNTADFVNNLGIVELEQGDLEAAASAFAKALTLNPQLAAAHHNLGLVRQKRHEFEPAAACFRQAIALAPNHVNAHLNLSNALSDMGRHGEAVAQLRKLIEIAPISREAHFNLAVALTKAGRFEEAERESRRVLDIDPRFAPAHENLGALLSTLGRFDEAVAAYEAALAIQPDYPEAILGLTRASKVHSTATVAQQIESLLAVDRPAKERALLHFALGKIYDDLGDYTRAFENYRIGNELGRPEAWFKAADWNAYIDRMISVMTPAFFAERKSFANPSHRPIFIFGMPRSGTTLVEQIIASHPNVAAAGEIDAIYDLIEELPARLGIRNPECIAAIDEALARQMAKKYLSALSAVDEAAARVTDKLPVNFLNLGLIALLFPNATFIHCRRDPMDTCLSCYFATFDRRSDYSYDLQSLGAYYRGYWRLMAHWRRALPVTMLEIDYEGMVADQETTTRRIIAHCGLDWDDRCLAFHKTERPVLTASAWQVRQPLYKSAVKRWQRYEAFLHPLHAALGEIETG